MRPLLLILFLQCAIMLNASAAERIVYSSLGEDGFWQLWEIAPDGSGLRQITTSAWDKREPFVLSDGRVACRTNNGKAFLIAADGSAEEEILAKYQIINHPQFSRDGATVLFTRFDPRSKDIRDIWKTDSAGDHGVILTRDHKFAMQPAFSWDASRIAFTNADASRKYHHLWIMDSDGANAHALTKAKGQDLFPQFSPDGKFVTFTSNTKDDNFEIYLVEVKSKSLQRLTKNPGLDSNSCFSPDGQKIAFVSNRSGSQQIWVMNRDGSDPVQLTQGKSESLEPHWAHTN